MRIFCTLLFITSFASAAFAGESAFYKHSDFFTKEEVKILDKVFAKDYFYQKNKQELSLMAKERIELIKEKVFVKRKIEFEKILPWPNEKYLFWKYGNKLIKKDFK